MNKKKSLILGWNSSESNLNVISLIFGFPLAKSWRAFPYLGLLISLGPSSGEDWEAILQKIQKIYIFLGS